MNRKQTLTALALVFAGTAAFAQAEAELQHFGAQAPSVTTRAAVRAEVLKARAANEAPVPPEADVAGLFQKAPVAAARSREDVRKEAIAATRGAQPARVQVGH